MYAYQYRSIHRPLICVSCSLTLVRFAVVLCNGCTSYSTYSALILHCKVFVQRFNNYASDLKLMFQQYCIIGVLWGASIHKTFYALTFKHSKPMIYATWTLSEMIVSWLRLCCGNYKLWFNHKYHYCTYRFDKVCRSKFCLFLNPDLTILITLW